jgi:hypothetical protein
MTWNGITETMFSFASQLTEYAVLVWDVKPEDYPLLGSVDREFNTNSLAEAMEIYDGLTDVFAKELHHFYQVATHGWESSSDCLLSWAAEEEDE